MLIITSKLPWRRPPPGPANINWAHPLANGLSAFLYIDSGQVFNLCRNGLAIEAARSGISLSAEGHHRVLVRDGIAASGVDLSSASWLQSQANVTIISPFVRTGGNATFFSGVQAGNTTGKRLGISVWNDNKQYFWVQNNNATYGTLSLSQVFREYALVFDGSASDNENRLKAYVNGEQNTLTYAGPIPATITSSIDTNLWMTKLYGGGAGAGAGYVADSLIYLRSLSAEEVREIYAHKYQILQPIIARRYFIPLAGGESQTIAVTTGNETGTGYALGTIHPRAIGLTAGSETGLGYALSITQPRYIAFTAGEETVVGYQLGLVQPRAITIVNGQETGIGYSVGTVQPRTIGLAAGSESGTGYIIGVSNGGGRTLLVETGNETGVGNAFSIIQHRTIVLTDGSETGISYTIGTTQPRSVDFIVGRETGVGYQLGIAQTSGIAVIDGYETGVGYALGIIQPRTLGLSSSIESGIGYMFGIVQGAVQTIPLHARWVVDVTPLRAAIDIHRNTERY